MHNSWLRRSAVVQSFLKQHGIKGKRTIQEGVFSCVIILSKQKVWKITVDVYGYMLYLHLIKKASINVPKLHKDHGCIGYVTNPSCSDHQLPVVCYEMENIPQNCLFENKANVTYEHKDMYRQCFQELEYISDYNSLMHRWVKKLDAPIASTLKHIRRYASNMENASLIIARMW